ncbi:response regulator transcription factor [Eubacterium barkeri]|uniref:Regulatory protein, luxR family n=1 Tax=Eubacterium barkeri TaxID=1528 RepID=A0A1H3BZF0_EUBBA|nr:LuxR C-terminal-related transcriptional regulator [Eubacterium barkeri]SDX47200.1 regulatory protein, luxR family [Eubacterium barkeri]
MGKYIYNDVMASAITKPRQSLLALDNVTYVPGSLDKMVERIANVEDQRSLNIELAYYRGDLNAVLNLTTGLTTTDWRVGQHLLYRMAGAVAAGQYDIFMNTKIRLDEVTRQLSGHPDQAFVELAQAVMAVSLYDTDKCPPWIIDGDFSRLPLAARPFACYPRAKYLLARGEFAAVLSLTETALSLFDETRYFTTRIYLRLMEAVSAVCQKENDRAKAALAFVMEGLIPDGLIMPLVEHYSSLSSLLPPWANQAPGFMNAVESLKMQIGYNWVDFHNHVTHGQISQILTSREYQVAYLAKCGYRNQEIAKVLNLSVATVKSYLQVVYEKLYIQKRKDLENLIL